MENGKKQNRQSTPAGAVHRRNISSERYKSGIFLTGIQPVPSSGQRDFAAAGSGCGDGGFVPVSHALIPMEIFLGRIS